MIRSGLTIVALAALVAFASSSPLKTDNVPSLEREALVYRLPTNVAPSYYIVELVPYIDEGVLTGSVTINITVSSPTNTIILHANDLTVTPASTRVFNSTNELNIFTQNADTIRQFYIITFESNIAAGEYIVAMNFDGHIRENMVGFYKSYYDIGNERRWIATTQFQATYARQAFPCFDEPALKANFSIRIAHFPNQTANSNMPVLAISNPDNTIQGRVWTSFVDTPVMSTYLLAFVVSDFTSLDNANGTFKVHARSNAIEHGRFALEAGEQQFRALENYLNLSDPLPKVDQFAIPDFSAGAMENWGLITYREELLLWQNGQSNSRHLETIASVMSHEFGHFWFGNLVSPEWWEYVWLNEGFATYFQYYATSLVHTDWRYMERFVVYAQQPIMIADSLESSLPMNNAVATPSSILSAFSGIAYSKAASVIRMLSNVMSQELYRQGLHLYLTDKAHSTATPADLWRHMQTVADANNYLQNHMSIETIFDSWANQAGYPLVTVTRNYTTTIAVVSQERFYQNPNSATADPDSQRWWIPLNFATQWNPARFTVTAAEDWLRAQDKSIIINGFSANTWVIFNNQQSGYYRVNYDITNWNMIINFLKDVNYEVIPPLNRASLIDDSLNLARGGYIEYSVPLNLTSYLVQESDYIPWQSAFNGFSYLNNMLASHPSFGYWQAYVRSLTTPLHNSLTWSVGAADDTLTKLHRGQILRWACNAGNENCVASANAQFNSWIANSSNTIDPDLKTVVYCTGIRQASEASWNTVWERFLASDLATEDSLLLQSMGCSQNPDILNRYLQLSITRNSGIRAQDTNYVFSAVLNGGPSNLDVALDFVINNYGAIAEFYGGMGSVGNMFVSIGNRITRQDQLDKLTNFINSNDLSDVSSSVANAVQAAQNNLVWIDEYSPSIVNWLHEQDLEVATAAATTFTMSFLAASIVALTIAKNYIMA